LTYNATERILYQAVDTGKLVRRYPLREGENKRALYLTREICDGLDGRTAAFKNYPMVEMESLIGRFCAGYSIWTSLSGDYQHKPDFERLKGLDECWVMCARKPKIWQLRIFGRFVDCGVFVGTSMHERRLLGSKASYNLMASNLPNEWVSLVGNLEPLRAKSAQEYLGGVVRDVDESE
jgi:hypothetical protein